MKMHIGGVCGHGYYYMLQHTPPTGMTIRTPGR